MIHAVLLNLNRLVQEQRERWHSVFLLVLSNLFVLQWLGSRLRFVLFPLVQHDMLHILEMDTVPLLKKSLLEHSYREVSPAGLQRLLQDRGCVYISYLVRKVE